MVTCKKAIAPVSASATADGLGLKLLRAVREMKARDFARFTQSPRTKS